MVIDRSVKNRNPVNVLSEKVTFRNAKGRFTKPHLATEFFVTIEGVKFNFDIPKFRPKTLKKVNLYVSEIVNELKLQFYGSQVGEIEARTALTPKKRARKITDKVTYETEVSESEYYSKRSKKNYQRVAYYYWFNPPYEISENKRLTSEIMKLVYSLAYRKGIEVINKHRLKGWYYQIKIVGGGQYDRLDSSGDKGSTFGYSFRRVSVPKNRNHFLRDIKFNYQKFMDSIYSRERGRFGGKGETYFERITSAQFDANNRKLLLFVYGIKLDFVKEIK